MSRFLFSKVLPRKWLHVCTFVERTENSYKRNREREPGILSGFLKKKPEKEHLHKRSPSACFQNGPTNTSISAIIRPNREDTCPLFTELGEPNMGQAWGTYWLTSGAPTFLSHYMHRYVCEFNNSRSGKWNRSCWGSAQLGIFCKISTKANSP